MNIFIDTEDMEERHTEQLYQEYLEKENKELHNKIDKAIEYLKDRIQVLEVSYSYDKNDEYLNAKLFGGKKELEMLLNEVLKDSDVDE